MLGIADNCIAGSIRVIRFTSKTLYIHDIHHSLLLMGAALDGACGITKGAERVCPPFKLNAAAV